MIWRIAASWIAPIGDLVAPDSSILKLIPPPIPLARSFWTAQPQFISPPTLPATMFLDSAIIRCFYNTPKCTSYTEEHNPRDKHSLERDRH